MNELKTYYDYATGVIQLAEETKLFWITPEQREVGSRILTLAHTLINNMDAGYGPLNVEDLIDSVKVFRERVLGAAG